MYVQLSRFIYKYNVPPQNLCLLTMSYRNVSLTKPIFEVFTYLTIMTKHSQITHSL